MTPALQGNASDIVRHPGYDTLVSPTLGWAVPAADAFVWVAYERCGDGMAVRHAGYAPTREAAQRAADRRRNEPRP